MTVLSKEKIEQLAPDQASLGAAFKLMKPGKWPMLARDAASALLWGECQGSGATPYRVVVSPADAGYKCTCPSRKFPCKHVLAVMWMACERPGGFADATPPGWVNDWLARRRPKAGSGSNDADVTASADGKNGAAAKSMTDAVAAAHAAETEPDDPKVAARAEAQRQRVREQREAAVLAGLDELERWVADELAQGLAGFVQRASQSSRALSTRLVDNKAQGLASRLDALAVDVFRVPEAMRTDLVIERLAGLVAICGAYRRQDKLTEALKHDVRRAVGWSVKRDELQADGSAPRVQSTWLVAATRSEVQPDKLRRLETWLFDLKASGPNRFALLLDFVPVSVGATASPFLAGEIIAGEVVYYPSPAPLRGQLASRAPVDKAFGWPVLAADLEIALQDWDAALAAVPWIETWPLAVQGVHLARMSPTHLVVRDNDGSTLPLDARQTDALLPLLGLEVALLLLWDGRFATVLAAVTPVGLWYED